MKNLIFCFIISSSFYYSQEQDKESESPCTDPIISFARKNGVKALPITDLPRYLKVSKQCREKGGEAIIDQIYISENNRDFKQSKFMSSWTSTYGMCVTAIIFYFFIGLITVEK